MSVFLIAEVHVTDDAWIPDYAAKVHDIVASHGGKYLSRSASIEQLEGESQDTTLIDPFPSSRLPSPEQYNDRLQISLFDKDRYPTEAPSWF